MRIAAAPRIPGLAKVSGRPHRIIAIRTSAATKFVQELQFPANEHVDCVWLDRNADMDAIVKATDDPYRTVLIMESPCGRLYRPSFVNDLSAPEGSPRWKIAVGPKFQASTSERQRSIGKQASNLFFGKQFMRKVRRNRFPWGDAPKRLIRKLREEKVTHAFRGHHTERHLQKPVLAQAC